MNIQDMIDFFPWWVWFSFCAAICAVLWVYLGRKAGMIAVCVCVVFLAFTIGRGGGKKDVIEEVERQTNEAVKEGVEKADVARTDSQRRNADPERVRDTDGWKRSK